METRALPRAAAAPSSHRSYPLYVHLSVLFSLLFLAMGGAITWFGYAQGRDLALSATDRVFSHITQETHTSLHQTLEPVSRFADILALQPFVEARSLNGRLQALPLLRQAFEAYPQIEAIYAGYADGDFFLFRKLAEDADRALFAAPANALYMIQSIERASDAPLRPLYLFFDERLEEVARRRVDEYDFDPRTRIWYDLAATPGKQVFTEPYTFFSTRVAGVTIAKRASARSVVGIDITLERLSTRLAKLSVLPGMRIVLYDEQGYVLARSDAVAQLARREEDGSFLKTTLAESGDPFFAALSASVSASGSVTDLNVDGRQWKSAVRAIDTARGPLYVATAVPLDELLQDLRTTREQHLLMSLALLVCAIPLTMLAARRVTRGIHRVTAQANEVRAFHFDGPAAERSTIREVDQLAQAMAMTRDTIRNFLDVVTSLAEEPNYDRLLRRVVQETCRAVDAVGGVVYLADQDEAVLTPAALMDGDGRPLEKEKRELPAAGDSPIAAAFRNGETSVIDLAAQRCPELSSYQALWPQQSLNAVAIPLQQRDGDRVGVLVLFTLKSDTPSGARLAFVEALSGVAAVVIETRHLIEGRKRLLDSFIKLVAGAIDAKSPYTGGHCQRVPALTQLLARAACEARTGPFRDFNLSEDEWEALQVASWLHDCGKVVTPEYVVDKATKLETIYNRLHEIRMRFEVLKRDARIEMLEALLKGSDVKALQAEYERRIGELDDDFAFVARCNVGGESMRPEDVERLERIAQRTWQRTLDDRIGLSMDELARKARTPRQPLPVTERLLDDKLEHLIERTPEEEQAVAKTAGKFNLQPPRYKYNLGELHNLRIPRGTLTEEERYIINHHIVQTIVMLEQLPFPKELRNVPEYAGGHHERVDGKGYPKGLKREQMSIPARIMAIADIFEALTASDRPYKKAKTLSESLRIMQRMKDEGHIDPDLYELFIDSGVWREYAERFLEPGQIDVSDVVAYR